VPLLENSGSQYCWSAGPPRDQRKVEGPAQRINSFEYCDTISTDSWVEPNVHFCGIEILLVEFCFQQPPIVSVFHRFGQHLSVESNSLMLALSPPFSIKTQSLIAALNLGSVRSPLIVRVERVPTGLDVEKLAASGLVVVIQRAAFCYESLRYFVYTASQIGGW
jgi:hypothetical protein